MSNERVLESLKFTRMCKFITAGRCCRGSTCNFAHSPDELKPMPDLMGTRLCAQFSATGRCRYGKVCKFAHGMGELKDVPVEKADREDAINRAESSSSTSRFTEPANILQLRQQQEQQQWPAPYHTTSEPCPFGYRNALATALQTGERLDGDATAKAIANLRNTFWLTEGAIDSLLLDTANGSEDSWRPAETATFKTTSSQTKRSASTATSSHATSYHATGQAGTSFWL